MRTVLRYLPWWVRVLVLVVVAVLGWSAWQPAAGAPVDPAPDPVLAQQISDMLSRIHVVDRLPDVPGYVRGCGIDKKTKAKQACVFGPAWKDVAHTGCDTRSRILRSQLTEITFKPGTRNCKVLSGKLHDPYSGEDLDFSTDNPDLIEIDHTVPLAISWRSGASAWPLDQREKLANDPDNLLAVLGKLNSDKSSKTLAQWYPPNRAFACAYTHRYLSVLVKYQLVIPENDVRAARAACPIKS